MTRTTRPARTTTAEQRPKRNAPRYAALKADAYADLPLEEKQRHDAHLDVDAIFDAIPRATLDRDSVGFPQSYRAKDSMSRSSDEGALNAVEAASQYPDPAVDWLAEAAECRALVTVVGRKARYHWPPVFAAGTVVSQDGEQITVGGRGNSVPICSWCGDPAPSGRHTNGKTMVSYVDGHAVHANGSPDCYHKAYTEKRKTGMTITAVLAAHSAERKAS